MCSARTFFVALVAAAFCAPLGHAVAQQRGLGAGPSGRSAPLPPFAQVVTQYFPQWDSTGDGILTPAKINASVANPMFHGEAAAALAAIHIAVRDAKTNLPPITQAYLLSNFSLQRTYRASLLKINTTPRNLFPQSLPSLDSCRQTGMGDCFFFAVVGAMVYQNPSAVKAMLTPSPDASTTVAFGDGHSVHVAPLTDAQIALSDTAGTNGLWLPVLENAYGKLRLEARQANTEVKPDTDAIAHGGDCADVIRKLTGCQPINIAFARARGLRGGANLTNIIRQDLTAALREHRLATAFTQSNSVQTLPPGLNNDHAYAVLGFNDTTGLVHLWNPHRNNFTPRGSDGPQYGYLTKAGQFDIPLSDLLQVFSGVTIETQLRASSVYGTRGSGRPQSDSLLR